MKKVINPHSLLFVGHVAATRKRSYQWCLTLTPNNTETIERMTCHVFCDKSGETLRAALTQLFFVACVLLSLIHI